MDGAKRKDAPVRISAENSAGGVQKACRDDDDLRCFAEFGALGLAWKGALEQLRASVRRQSDVLFECLAPIRMQVERSHFQHGALLLQCAVRAPNLENRLDSEERGGQVVRESLPILARHADRVCAELTLDGEVRRLRSKEVIDDGP